MSARGLKTTQGLGRRWSWFEHLGHGTPTNQPPTALQQQTIKFIRNSK
jgi:hypothetical protein